MIKALLRKGDGIGSRIWLRSVVKEVQHGLVDAGESMKVDGKFGGGTQAAARRFQTASGVKATGVFDRATWTAISGHLPKPPPEVGELLKSFEGSLDWVHEQEGHLGKAYWPGGNSGVTLDPGVDLGHAPWDFVERLYAPFLTKTQLEALRKVSGFKAEDGREAIKQSTVIRGIRISQEQALAIMPHSARPYWEGIARRFKALSRKDTPPSVQTVLLSLAYNRGILNRHLESLGAPVQDRKWAEVARLVGSMQQRHKLKGIRIRRRREEALIDAELSYLAS